MSGADELTPKRPIEFLAWVTHDGTRDVEDAAKRVAFIRQRDGTECSLYQTSWRPACWTWAIWTDPKNPGDRNYDVVAYALRTPIPPELDQAIAGANIRAEAAEARVKVLETALRGGPGGVFRIGDRVRKTKGPSWQGRVCGTYRTALTPDGYCVESEREPGSVQIYPGHALEMVEPADG